MKKLDISTYRIKTGNGNRFTAAVISDLHGEEYDYILREVKERKADVILIPGDVTESHIAAPVYVSAFFEECLKICPVYMSLGNHENNSVSYVKNAAEKCGIILLDNTYTDFRGIKIGGLTSGFIGWTESRNQGHFRKTPEPDLKFLSDFSGLDGFKLLLCHHPEYYPEYIRNTSVNLTLSGHAHGGQWRIFGHPFFAPGQRFFPEYAQGFIENRLIVSRGLANNGPVPRFGNPRELIFIDFD